MSRSSDKTRYEMLQDQGVWRRKYEALVEKYNRYWQSVDPDYVPRRPVAPWRVSAGDE